MDNKTAVGIAKFMAHVQDVMEKHHALLYRDHKDAPPFGKMRMEEMSKWAKILRPNGNIYVFIAVQDFDTRALGHVTTGDIHKPATYLAPAKHSRGSVFNPDTWACAGPLGIANLR